MFTGLKRLSVNMSARPDDSEITSRADSSSLAARRRWTAIAQIVGVIAVAAGAAWAVYAERATIRSGIRVLVSMDGRTHWIYAAVVAETASMVAFALLQRRLLHAAGGRLSMSWLLSVAYLSSATPSLCPSRAQAWLRATRTGSFAEVV